MSLVFTVPARGALLLAVLASAAGHAAGEQAQAMATLVAPVAITPAADLAFGRFTPGAGGDVQIAVDGSRASSGAVVLLREGSGQAARFEVSGAASAGFGLRLPETVAVVREGGNETMRVHRFVSSPVQGLLDARGRQALNVGATLTAAARQPPGRYRGSFEVAVEYD